MELRDSAGPKGEDGDSPSSGRVYNPVVGKFISADPVNDCGLGTQGWNRYSYIGNRALSATDPTGFDICVLGSLTFFPRYSFSFGAGAVRSSLVEDVQERFIDFHICFPDDWVPEPSGTPEAGARTKCGPAWGIQLSGDFGLWDFSDACREHDGCYEPCGGKLNCDSQFQQSTYSECSQVFDRAISRGYGIVQAIELSAACYGTANSFTALIVYFGGISYRLGGGHDGGL